MKLFILYLGLFLFLICHFSLMERDDEEKYLQNCSLVPGDAVRHDC